MQTKIIGQDNVDICKWLQMSTQTQFNICILISNWFLNNQIKQKQLLCRDSVFKTDQKFFNA